MVKNLKASILLVIVILSFCKGISALPSAERILQLQVNIVLDLINELNDMYSFDNIIIYRTPDRLYEPPAEDGIILRIHGENYNTKKTMIFKSLGNILADYVFSNKIYKPLMIFTISPWDYVNDTKSIPNLGEILSNENLAVVILNDIFNTELKEFVALSLGASLETKIVFLLIGHEMTNVFAFIRLEKMKRFFRWCWSKNILNAILMFQKDALKDDTSELKLEVYTYTPFPNAQVDLITLTGQHPRDYFRGKIKDVLGYEFKTPIYHDKPSVFKSLDPKTGIETITGISGHIYVEFVKNINATFLEIPPDDKNPVIMESMYELLNARNIDMSIHPYTALLPYEYFGSYPITNTNSCVVVPVIPEVFPGLYIPLTFNLNMWAVLFLMFITFQITYLLINYRNYGEWRLWDAILISLRGMLSIPLDNLVTGLTTISIKRILFVNMFLLLTGMLYCQMFMAGLSSFLSSTLYPKQLETLEDLRAANISIMLVDYVFNTYNYLDLIPANFTDNLLITDSDTVSQHLNNLNTSYAYVVYNEEWKVMQRLQMNLWKPRFKIVPSLCIPNVYLTFPMQFNSPFYHPLKEFILRTQSTGLEARWSDMVFLEIQQSSGVSASKMENQEHPVPLTLEHLTYVFYVFAFGITLSFGIFFWELKRGKVAVKKSG